MMIIIMVVTIFLMARTITLMTIVNNRSRKKRSVVKEGLIKFIIFAKI